jgi:predicted DNA repair protein MutK
MKALSVLGTAAMFLVGGGILVHGIGLAQHSGPGLGQTLLSAAADGLTGVVAGALVFAGVAAWSNVRSRWQRSA